jgi:LPXTG-site transpeptidase (sortase) family protein
MQHKHHAAQHVFGFLIGVVFIGSTLGGVSSLLGTHLIDSANALRGQTMGEERSVERAEREEKRRIRRTRRLQRSERVVSDIDVTYPMHAAALSGPIFNPKWEVVLYTGFLSYPQLNIEAPIGKPTITHWKNRNWRALEDQMQYGLMNGVVAYPHSPSFGENGNVIIAGHSSAPTLEAMGSAYEDVFASLPYANIGDRIDITDGTGNSFTYQVFETAIVPPTYTSILMQNPSKKELLLFTCYPVGTTNDRFLVKARLVNL